ncbi:uncharacterized protein LOC100209915 [Hydra vulgaris]|uniref:Uncharacterized protein LOC100209915 n=1 Tax=Hydra vulgaris TaxID=6087 RepID=A0ABM4C2H9_HYDVU
MNLKFRVLTMTFMSFALIFLLVSTMSTGWRMDTESRMNVYTTFGMWRICRDIIFGATVDHNCLSSLANAAPAWYQVVRAFMIIAVIFNLIAFLLGFKTLSLAPALKHRNDKPPATPMLIPALFMFLTTLFSLLGLATFGVATAMNEALYFPEKLPPTWANSWAQVWAKLNSLPSDRPDLREIVSKYGYSFGLGWLGFILALLSGVINIIAKS